ncbi:MAG: 2-hydroxyhepta-2,4-diene-1,7-dioate isomerase [Acidobacteria bacterium RIFCSPLOWO2_02_FULL_68_18]|nr:MAG: 2-hydroxyhepta-2,4-diene-1,7-dioate isomerase [Acidobacteria bacterium RIFCSPLOWO2_02_FULL_68_18]OFW51477.1 MAG: 2-hydroxyhepta-2,4-diene-1,7-dioate isomerase [Acidobacteria bacterium RIFCSPLOWO2_12_FULL_68_19]
MRLCRFDEGRLGVADAAGVRDVTAALDVLPGYRYPFPPYDVLVAHLPQVVARAGALAGAAPVLPLGRLRLLSPVANPGKIIAAPVNYQKHLDEVKSDVQIHANNPAHTITIQKAGVFLKASSSLVGPGEGVVIRKPERRTDHEVELAAVIGKTASHVRAAQALDYVAGYTIGLDISIRGSEDRSLRKSADTYTVLGPWLVTADEIPDPGTLDLQITVNGELRQQSNTKYMILGVADLVEMASSFYTLHPGDVVLTGTPEGVSPIEPGDRIVATVERIGTMEVSVRAEEDGAPQAGAAHASAKV